MPNWYKATCMKEIYWKGKTYRIRDKINIIEDDVYILTNAGVIGGIKKIQPENRVEFAVEKAPENRKRTHHKKDKS